MKKTILKKGYTFLIYSWENDGDNPRDTSFTVATKQEAQYVEDIIENLFYRGPLNNLYSFSDIDDESLQYIHDYLKDKYEHIKVFIKDYNEEDFEDDLEGEYNILYKLPHILLGGGEFFCRAFESYEIVYSETDVELDIVGFLKPVYHKQPTSLKLQ